MEKDLKEEGIVLSQLANILNSWYTSCIALLYIPNLIYQFLKEFINIKMGGNTVDLACFASPLIAVALCQPAIVLFKLLITLLLISRLSPIGDT